MKFRETNSYRDLKKAAQYLALAGFIVSLCIHLAALKGEVLFQGAMIMHLGVFIVFFPAVATVSVPNKLEIRGNLSWKEILKGCPPWMIMVAYVIAAYAVINFVMFVQNAPTDHSGSVVSTSAEELKGFSGHWMIFYWLAYALIYSHLNYKEPQKLQ